MIFYDIGVARELMAMRLSEAHRAREQRVTLAITHRPRHGWLREQLGRRLIALGQRLMVNKGPERPIAREASQCTPS